MRGATCRSSSNVTFYALQPSISDASRPPFPFLGSPLPFSVVCLALHRGGVDPYFVERFVRPGNLQYEIVRSVTFRWVNAVLSSI